MCIDYIKSKQSFFTFYCRLFLFYCFVFGSFIFDCFVIDYFIFRCFAFSCFVFGLIEESTCAVGGAESVSHLW